MSKPDALEKLLTDALSAQEEPAPAALRIERTRLLLLRGRAANERRVEENLALVGCLIAVAEILVLALAGVFLPPADDLGAIAHAFFLFQAVCLFTGSIGSRVAIKRLQTN